ncbi:MAG: bifunctional phosphopantothenoylcysteine decarboxylase/phosphopantothenate synthase [Planctomycetaceae bacterium]|nr:bifunctional phosphopantothenoylcysteine decarboxylase/phosphopantothenate synthase [Planctomycetaceae bacterium]
MNILVTAGNTQTPVDDVRCITNIFTGRTGGQIAARAFERGHAVTLLTSHPAVLDAIPGVRDRTLPEWRIRPYRTFDDLETGMSEQLLGGKFDAVIHAAAVSDYRVVGAFTFHDGQFENVTAGKVKSSHPELWLKLTPTPKLVDKIRSEWGFAGVLVKFKLEVGLTEAELLAVAEKARVHSHADLMSANTLEGYRDCAFVGAGPGGYHRVTRAELPDYLLGRVETLRPSPPSPT